MTGPRPDDPPSFSCLYPHNPGEDTWMTLDIDDPSLLVTAHRSDDLQHLLVKMWDIEKEQHDFDALMGLGGRRILQAFCLVKSGLLLAVADRYGEHPEQPLDQRLFFIDLNTGDVVGDIRGASISFVVLKEDR